MDGINLITALIKVIILYLWRGSRSGAKQLKTQQKSCKFKMHQLPHDPSFQSSTFQAECVLVYLVLFWTNFSLNVLKCTCSFMQVFTVFRLKQKFWNFKHLVLIWYMLINWVWLGQTGKHLTHHTRTSLPLVCISWPQAKYFPMQPYHSVKKYIISYLNSFTSCSNQ